MPLQRGDIVLVDTNVIIEAYRNGCLNVIASEFSLRTVEKVIEETQTGSQNRQPEERIDEANLRVRLAHVETITPAQRAAFMLDHGEFGLDDGERDLWVYAIATNGPWLLNSPDKSSCRVAHHRQCLDRLISLEEMVNVLRHRLARPLRDNYTSNWLSTRRLNLATGIQI